MGRNKIEIKKIDDDKTLLVTFAKRKLGLYNKAYELSQLCECDIAILIYTNKNRLHKFASGDLDSIINRYRSGPNQGELTTTKDMISRRQKKAKNAEGSQPPMVCDFPHKESPVSNSYPTAIQHIHMAAIPDLDDSYPVKDALCETKMDFNHDEPMDAETIVDDCVKSLPSVSLPGAGWSQHIAQTSAGQSDLSEEHEQHQQNAVFNPPLDGHSPASVLSVVDQTTDAIPCPGSAVVEMEMAPSLGPRTPSVCRTIQRRKPQKLGPPFLSAGLRELDSNIRTPRVYKDNTIGPFLRRNEKNEQELITPDPQTVITPVFHAIDIDQSRKWTPVSTTGATVDSIRTEEDHGDDDDDDDDVDDDECEKGALLIDVPLQLPQSPSPPTSSSSANRHPPPQSGSLASVQLKLEPSIPGYS